MLCLKSEKLEVRGVKPVTSKKGNTYHILNCEDMHGDPVRFFVRDVSVLPRDLKKGEGVVLSLVYNNFKDLEVKGVTREA